MTESRELDRIIGFLHEDLEQVERVMREALRSVAPVIPAIGEHTFGSGGKRIRPVVVLLASRLCGYRGPRAIQIATAAEYLHSASLPHDDVVDGAEIAAPAQRERPFGSKLAILVGDFLFARACQTLVEPATRHPGRCGQHPRDGRGRSAPAHPQLRPLTSPSRPT